MTNESKVNVKMKEYNVVEVVQQDKLTSSR